MSNRISANLRKAKVGLLDFVGRSPRLQSLNTKIKNRKLTISTASLFTAILGIWTWQALASSAGPAATSLPSQAGNRVELNTQSNLLSPADNGASAGSASNSSSTDINININGQDVALPQDGSVHKVIKDANGTTTIDVNVDSSSSSTGTSSNSNSIVIKQKIDQQSSGGTMN